METKPGLLSACVRVPSGPVFLKCGGDDKGRGRTSLCDVHTGETEPFYPSSSSENGRASGCMF